MSKLINYAYWDIYSMKEVYASSTHSQKVINTPIMTKLVMSTEILFLLMNKVCLKHTFQKSGSAYVSCAYWDAYYIK
jgi:hypothetical protein